MNEEKVKATILELQEQVDRIAKDETTNMDRANWGEEGVLITGNEAKALIELWNWYQMLKPNEFDHHRNRRP